MSAVYPCIRHIAAGYGRVRAFCHILAVIPHHRACAAVHVHCLIRVVSEQDLRAVRQADTKRAADQTSLYNEHHNIAVGCLSNNGARLDRAEARLLVDKCLAVNYQRRRKLDRVADV